MSNEFKYTREWTDEGAFPLLGFTKNWENPSDYPTYEPDEMQVRKDMQSLHDEVKDFLNNELIPRVVAEDATVEAWTYAEEQRAANEVTRVANEEQRVAAEQERVNETSGIVAQAAAQANAAAESARLAKQAALGQIPDGSITEAKLADDVDYKAVHAAPAGYGLGGGGIDKLEQVVDDFNNYTRNGWYYVASTTNVLNTPDVSYGYGVLQVTAASSIIKQELLVPDWGDPNKVQWRILQRVNTGTWSDWEWVNPHMALGVEYRTTERYLGKPVYVRLIDCGTLPSSSSKVCEPGYVNVDAIVRTSAYATNGTQRFSMPTYKNTARFSATQRYINLETAEDFSTYGAYVTVWYTKTTD